MTTKQKAKMMAAQMVVLLIFSTVYGLYVISHPENENVAGLITLPLATIVMILVTSGIRKRFENETQ